MKNNELTHYLNSGVKVKYKWVDEINYKLSSLNSLFHCINNPLLNITPLLYPLSCLTETINHEGKYEIPLVELAKIEGTYKGEEYEILRDIIAWKVADGNEWLFRYSSTYNSFFKSLEGCSYTATNQLALFQYLFSRRINVFGIEAIDPRTLDINPYLITNRRLWNG